MASKKLKVCSQPTVAQKSNERLLAVYEEIIYVKQNFLAKSFSLPCNFIDNGVFYSVSELIRIACVNTQKSRN